MVLARFGVDVSSIVDSALRVFGTELGICGLMTIFNRWADRQDKQAEKRQEMRMRGEEPSRKTGIRPATINEIYNEKIERINLEYLSRICQALDCQLDDLLQYIPDEEYYKYRRRPEKKKS